MLMETQGFLFWKIPDRKCVADVGYLNEEKLYFFLHTYK